MKTPITEAALERLELDCDDSCLPIDVYVDGKEYTGGAIDADTARKLELDRAALMEALNKIANRHVIAGSTGDYREGQLHALASCRDVSSAALAAARANFPDAEQPTNKLMPTLKRADGALLELPELLTCLSEMKTYIEKAEVCIDGEWGSCRRFDEIHKAGEVTSAYDLICEILSANK
jgi:hypothetical protein